MPSLVRSGMVLGVVLSVAAIALTLSSTVASPVSLVADDNEPSVFSDPEEVLKANRFIARNQAVRMVFNTIDDTRDEFEQLKGSLRARSADEDCDAIHSIAHEVKDAHQRFEMLEIQYKNMKRADRQAVAAYLQDKLIHLVHDVTSELVRSLLVCERSQSLYHQAVANIRLVSAKLDMYEKRISKQRDDCPVLQKTFHEAIEEIKDFHASSDKILTQMKGQNMIVAADQALLERESRINSAEHSLYQTYGNIWAKSCVDKTRKALGLDEDGSSSGGASGGGSGSSAESGGSASK